MTVVVILIILLAWFWISVSAKKKMLCNQLSYYITAYKIWYVKFMGKYKGIVKTAVDFSVFWLIFLWNDGCIFSGLLNGIKILFAFLENLGEVGFKYLLKFKDVFVFLSPYGRPEAQNEQFQYCLIFGSVITALAFLLYMFMLQDEFNWVVSVVGSPIAAFAVWYLFYYVCEFFKVYTIATHFYIWASIISILIAIGSFLVITFILGIFFLA